MKKKRQSNETLSRSKLIYGLPPSDLKTLLAERAAATDTDVGAASFRFLRPPPDLSPLAGTRPDDPDPCGGIPFVSQPVLAVRVIQGSCPAQETLDAVAQALKAYLKEPGSRFRLTDPEVRASCTGDGNITFMVWPTTEPDRASCESLARDRAELPTYIARGGNFGIYVAKSLIESLAQAVFSEMPKRLTPSGAPSADGAIHLTSMTLDFVETEILSIGTTPNATLITTVNGFDDRTWPDIDFSVFISDTFKSVLASDFPTFEPPPGVTNLLDVDTKEDSNLSKMDLVLAANNIAALFASVSIRFGIDDVLADATDAYFNQPSGGGTGAGGALLTGIPLAIPFPAEGGLPEANGALARMVNNGDLAIGPVTKKQLVINYGTPIVNASGVYFPGFTTGPVSRTATVRIVGPSDVFVGLHSSYATAHFSIRALGFLGQLNILWTGGPALDFSTTHAKTTTITFPRRNLKPDQSYQATIQVSVSDTDASIVRASLSVTVSVLSQSESSTDAPP